MFISLAFLFVGERGSYTVAVLQLLLGFLTFTLTVVPPPNMPFVFPPRRNTIQLFVDWWRRTPFVTKFVNLSLCLLAGAGLGGITYYYAKGPPLEMADLVVVQGENLKNADRAILAFPSPTPDRDNVGIKLTLDNVIDSGDCVTLAQVTLYPVINGAPQDPIEIEQLADETRVEVGGSVRDLKIGVEADMDAGCQVVLWMSGAVFYD
jgi:hypothetical protein